MRWSVLAVLVAVTAAGPARGAGESDGATPPSVATAAIPIGGEIQRVEVPFGEGETLRYALSWLAIGAGELELTFESPTPYRDKLAYTIRMHATSNDFFSKFFYVEDEFLSRVESERFESMRYEKHTREGKRVKDQVSTFDLDRRLTMHKGKTIELPPHVLDTLSAVYYLRLLPLEAGKRFLLDAHSNGKNYGLEVAVVSFEEIEVPAGRFRAWKVQPKLAEGLFKKEGELFIWFANDEARTPVRIRTYLPFGHITAALLAPGQAAPVGKPATESAADRPLAPPPTTAP